jgi:predicted nucleotide-binding protein (sugar kinase/HSP70/actin superfamily)
MRWVMYKIIEEEQKNKHTMLIPAMLDAHFPLLRYAFESPKYHAVILEEEENITNIGLRYTHNDLCYPAILIIGQMISALQSGKYDLKKTVLMIPQAGDACRGSNYIGMIRKALNRAGFSMVTVMSLNVKGLEKEQQVPMSVGMALRALAAVMYGDMLMLLNNQITPYEVNQGETNQYVQKWTKTLAEDLKHGRNLSRTAMKKTFLVIAEDFKKIPTQAKNVKKVGIVGELYIKYCRLGNWNMEQFLREQNCEYYVNGFSWYGLYYIHTHSTKESFIMGKVYKFALKYIGNIQKNMVNSIREYGFYSMDEFEVFKKKAEDIVSSHCSIGDGWLIGAEIANHVKNGYPKVICVQPFGCLPNQVCGKGLYPSIQRKLENAQLVSVDFDSSGTDVNVKNRIKLLLDF